MSDYFIARQPIFTPSLKVYAYELLFRNADTGQAPKDIDDDAATAQVLATSEDVGLKQLVGEHSAFINLPQRFLEEPELLPLQPDGLVLEVLEQVDITPDALAGMRTLASRGFALALDDYTHDARFAEALAYVAIVKLEIPKIAPDDWELEIQRLKKQGVRVLAEKVETAAEFERLKELGCDYFQGYFFAKPSVLSGKRLSANKLAMLQLLARVNSPDTNIETLSDLVSQDVALSVRTMNYANSAASGLTRKLESVREAVVYVGRESLRRWVTLFLMSKIEDKPDELTKLALTRAKFLELVAIRSKQADADIFFTVGLFSLLSALMDAPMDTILEHLSIQGELHAALTARAGVKGEAMTLAEDIEKGSFASFPSLGLSAGDVAEEHGNAMRWADATMSSMTSS